MPDTPTLKVNGRFYPLWSQFVANKEKWIGGTLQDDGAETTITDVVLRPNGDDSAVFGFEGFDFDCVFDVRCGGVVGGQDEWTIFHSIAGDFLACQKKDVPE